MDNNPHQIKCSSRHRRKLCGHCNEMLSYSAFQSHKMRFFDQSTQKWLTKTGEKVPKDEEPLARDDEALVNMAMDISEIEYNADFHESIDHTTAGISV